MSLKLDLQLCSILEHPLHDIRVGGGALDRLAMLQGTPEAAEALELDQVPDRAEGRGDDGRFGDGGRGWDAGCHFRVFWCWQIGIDRNWICDCCRDGV